MQDKYAGDVGDFGKFVLLRQLSRISSRQLRLGINWYLTDRVEHTSNDGGHVAYLHHNGRFRDCDPVLYAKLQHIVKNSRSVRALEQSQILPDNTVFYSEPIPFASTNLLERVSKRERWFEQSLHYLRPAQIFFLDPDNGIQTPRVRKTQTRAIKYAFIDEIQRYFDVCNILIVYSHQDRSSDNHRARQFKSILSELGQSATLRVLRFNRLSVRYYAFFCKRHFASDVDQLFRTLVAAPYDFLFRELTLKLATVRTS